MNIKPKLTSCITTQDHCAYKTHIAWSLGPLCLGVKNELLTIIFSLRGHMFTVHTLCQNFMNIKPKLTLGITTRDLLCTLNSHLVLLERVKNELLDSSQAPSDLPKGPQSKPCSFFHSNWPALLPQAKFPATSWTDSPQ